MIKHAPPLFDGLAESRAQATVHMTFFVKHQHFVCRGVGQGSRSAGRLIFKLHSSSYMSCTLCSV